MPQICFFFPRDLALKVYLTPSPAFKTPKTQIKPIQERSWKKKDQIFTIAYRTYKETIKRYYKSYTGRDYVLSLTNLVGI